MPESTGVVLPSDSAPELCQLAIVTCSGFALVSRQPSSETTTTITTTTFLAAFSESSSQWKCFQGNATYSSCGVHVHAN